MLGLTLNPRIGIVAILLQNYFFTYWRLLSILCTTLCVYLISSLRMLQAAFSRPCDHLMEILRVAIEKLLVVVINYCARLVLYKVVLLLLVLEIP